MAFVLFGMRLVPGLVLILFGVAKAIQHQSATVASVQSYRLLGLKSTVFVAAALPGIELGLGILMLVGDVTRVVATLATALFIVFGTAVASAIARGQTNDCGCGGALRSTQVSWKLVTRNAVLAALSATIAILGPGAFSLVADRAELAWIVTGTVAAIATVLTVTRLLQTRTPVITSQGG